MKEVEISKFLVDGYQVFENVVPMQVILEVRSFLSERITEKPELRLETFTWTNAPAAYLVKP